MKVTFLFRPNFCEWPLAACSNLEQRIGSLTVSGIVRGKKRFYRRIQSYESVQVQPLHWLAELENEWLNAPVDEGLISRVRQQYGDELLNRALMSSRHLGAGWIRSADLTRTQLVEESGHSRSRDRYVPRLVQFVGNYLDDFNPDLVFVDDVGNMTAYVLAKVAEARGIPFRKLTPARHENRYLLDHSVEDRFVPVARSYQQALDDREDLGSWTEEAREHLRSFRNQPQVPDYSETFRGRAREERSTSRLLKELFKSVYALPKSLVRGQPFEPNEPTPWARRSVKLKKIARKICLEIKDPFPDPGTLPDRPFVYFPLQVSPEVSSLIYSPHHTNPLPVIELLSRQLPFGWEVLVKETPRMLGRRPGDFYQRLQRMPSVSLTSPFTDTFHCLRASEFVFTVTGTPGWEAMKLKKPALIAGEEYPFLVLENGLIHEPEYLNWGEAVENIKKVDPVSDENLTLYLAALLKHSFPLTISFSYDEITQETLENYQEDLDRFCEHLLTSLSDS